MKYLALLIITTSLVACGTKDNPILIVDRPVVFIPDDRYFRCPVITDFPDPSTLTDEMVAEIIIKLDTNNRICRQSINAIKNQLRVAKSQLEAPE